jgi:hypothetical protein
MFKKGTRVRTKHQGTGVVTAPAIFHSMVTLDSDGSTMFFLNDRLTFVAAPPEFKHGELVRCSHRPLELSRRKSETFIRHYAGLIGNRHHVYANSGLTQGGTYSVEYVQKLGYTREFSAKPVKHGPGEYTLYPEQRDCISVPIADIAPHVFTRPADAYQPGAWLEFVNINKLGRLLYKLYKQQK